MIRLIAPILSLGAIAAAQTPCFEYAFGTRLTMADDSVSAQTLPFTFPWNGASVTTITICSNGFVWLGAATSADYTPTEAEFLNLAGRIAPLWCDLNPAMAAAGGGVWVNLIPPSTTTTGRAVITWDRCAYYGTTSFLTMQLQLDDTGAATVFYDAGSSVYTSFAIAGTTQGGGAAANRVNLSAAPHSSGSFPTIYELFNLGGGGVVDLIGSGQQWIPNGTNGVLVIPNPCQVGAFLAYGSGCPKNATIYESFATGTCDLSNQSFLFVTTGSGYVAVPGGGFDNSYASALTGVGDDTIHQGLVVGFPFPYAGQTITAVALSSNGYLWMGANPSSDYSATVAEFLNLMPRIAPLWRDLTPNTGGAVYWDSNPNFAMATWVGVPTYGVAGSASNIQVKLYASGNIEFNYGPVTAAGGTFGGATQTMTGFTEGNAAFNPGTVDLTAVVPGLTVGASGMTPLVLRAQAGSSPRLGTTFTAELTNIPAGTVISVFAIGLFRVAIDASGFGMPGCTQHVSLDATLLALTGGSSTTTFALGIPNSTGFLGTQLHVQGLTFSPGFTPLGVIASNGGTVLMGM